MDPMRAAPGVLLIMWAGHRLEPRPAPGGATNPSLDRAGCGRPSGSPPRHEDGECRPHVQSRSEHQCGRGRAREKKRMRGLVGRCARCHDCRDALAGRSCRDTMGGLAAIAACSRRGVDGVARPECFAGLSDGGRERRPVRVPLLRRHRGRRQRASRAMLREAERAPPTAAGGRPRRPRAAGARRCAHHRARTVATVAFGANVRGAAGAEHGATDLVVVSFAAVLMRLGEMPS